MIMKSRRGSLTVMLVMLAAGTTLPAAIVHPAETETVLRVCADPHNLPASNDRGEGFENRIAQALAHDLGRTVEYTYFPQRMGFVRHTLRERDTQTQQFKCDVIIGVPKGYELTATTRPYMHSTYALIHPGHKDFEGFTTAEDLLKLPPARLKSLRIGIFGRSPATDWLLRNELLDRAVMYAQQSGDPQENPTVIIGRELSAGNIDLAVVWGPIAGQLAREHPQAPAWHAVPFRPDPQIRFDYEISMGVRFGEKEWKDTLDAWIAANQHKIDAILMEFRVPLVDANGNVTAGNAAAFSDRPVPQ